MPERIETVIIGGGQAGLSLSYFLTRAGREHIVLEKAPKAADAWRSRRWDSFTLVTPNWTFMLPGAEYDGEDEAGFMTKNEITARFEQYQRANRLPVLPSTEVTRVEPVEGRFRYRVWAGSHMFEAVNVVLASGMYQKVKIPPFASQIPPEILQIPSDAYRNPQALPPGAVVVVGSAQSGCQIAEELHEAGRKVYLSTGSAGRIPRRYRGADGFDWLIHVGFFDRTAQALNSPRDRFISAPHLSGKGGGHEINLHKFSRDGIILLGHAIGCEDGRLAFAPDLRENLARADKIAADAVRLFDAYAQRHALDLPAEEVEIFDDGYRAPLIETLDLKAAGVGVVIWATGYTFDYSLVQLPLLDAYRFPAADRGVTRHPGLYLLGMTWMNKLKSGFLMGIGEAAQHLAEVIAEPAGAGRRL